jgi:hypothetical protein
MPPLFVIIMELYIQTVDIYLFSFYVPATGFNMPDEVSLKPPSQLLKKEGPVSAEPRRGWVWG